jgi:phage tail-like protein
MTIAAVASAAASASRPRPARRFDLTYGLAYRFTVKIQGVDIGRWQSCSGLKVDFKPMEIKSGGRYDSVRYLAGEVSYPRVVLKRAIVASQSRSLQAWLADTAQAWVNGRTSAGAPATITVYDSYGEQVMTWTLVNARPCAWSGPDLDANASKVAIETLELVHEGFVVGPATATDSAASASQSEFSLSDGSATVVFPYPPTEIQVQRSQQPNTSVDQTVINVDGKTAESSGQQVSFTRNKSNVTSYLLNNLIVEGEGARETVALLTSWATRVQTKKSGSAKDTPVMPDLTFTWGEGFSGVPVQLMTLAVSYTRFSPTGNPIRAKVNLKLNERVAPPPPEQVKLVAPVTAAPSPPTPPRAGATNPSSGGIAGRASYLLGAGETLHAVARRTYGSAHRWRDIAAANGVDDPFRIRPGALLYLPAASELESGEADAVEVP